LIHVRCKHH